AARALGATARRRLAPPAPGGWDTPLDPIWEVRVEGRKLKGFVDLANDVTAEDLRLAQREGYESVEHAKRYTTLGMAPDQGKTSGVVGMALLAQARGETPEAVGTTTFRPPYAPVSLGIFAGAEGGPMWEPVRRTPFHGAAEAAGAVFVDAGLWKRAWYFPRRGEGLAAASRREAAMVRDTVGLCDVSTLGKLRVQGPDAAAFLDRIYSNLMSTLPPGKARYGFMLREDGVAYDDGAVWRWSETDFLVTATTAHAAGVHDHLELWAARWPDLRVDIACETEAWAALALAGPRARAALARATSADVSDAALPFMGLASAEVCGAQAKIARISFSGELAYEIYVRPSDAEGLWEGLSAAAQAERGGPYGLEALDILRVEKGHVTGREIDGRMTLADLGLPRMMSKKKAFLGQALAGRPGLTDPARPSLVGLEPTDAEAAFMAGAVLAPPGHRQGHGLGHVASIADSPARGRRIALGFVAGGLAEWEGRVVVAKDPIARAETPLRVVSPHFVDPDGERLRG
ncbi:MAG: glycine cleavage T C-terminal barrel domain-containing protein, partial [Pseudomonadota bacterium]